MCWFYKEGPWNLFSAEMYDNKFGNSSINVSAALIDS